MWGTTRALLWQTQKTKFLVLSLVAAFGMSACSKNKTTSKPSDDTPSKPTSSAGGQRDPLGKRYCTLDITSSLDLNTWEGRFAELFQWDVEGFEDNPTLCADLDSYGSTLQGAIEIEYEDNEGIGFLTLDESVLFYGSIKRSSGTSKIELIYSFTIDGTGFLLQLKGQSNSNSDPVNATIRYHQLASYEEQISEAIKEAQKKCKNGTWTVAQCLGYNFPQSYWWEESSSYTSPQQQQIDLAHELLNDNSKSKELGKVKFKLSEVMN